MDREQQQRIIARALAHLEAGTTDTAPSERRVPTARYVSDEHHALEQERVFRRVPVMVAHASEVARAGDFLTSDRYGVPLLVTRDQSGAVHVFLNACLHRGARLVGEERGCGQKAFSCPYHGWTYGNDGRLLHVTHPECFPSFDKGTHGLVALPAEERHGFIWAVLDPQGRLDLDGFLGEAGADLAWLELADYVPYRPIERRCPANWKLFLEASAEHYHLPYAHSEEIYKYFLDTLVADRLGLHQRLVTFRKSIAKLAGVERSRWRLRPGASLAYLLFPNVILTAHPDHVAWARLYPAGPDAFEVNWVMLIPRTASDGSWTPYWEQARQSHERALDEDLAVVAGIHAGMRGGSVSELLLGCNEFGVGGCIDSMAAVLAGEAP